MRKASTKLLVIVITTAAIIAMAATTGLSAATPAFAKKNCNEEFTVCTGGSGCGRNGCPAGTSLVIHLAEVAGGRDLVVFWVVVASILIQTMAALDWVLAEVQAASVYTQNNQLF
jgi:hypothetical protein